MESAAKRCVQWGIALIIAGGLAVSLLPALIGLLADSAGATANIGVGALELVINLVRWALIPMGTTLIGAAVIIRVFAPALKGSSEPHTPGT